MEDIKVRIYKGDVEIASEAICSPVTAAEAKDMLKEANVEYIGKLSAANSATILGGGYQLRPGATYNFHLQIQPQPGK